MSAATSRRAFVTTGAGLVLGAAGLLLPAAGDEAAGKGAMGGSLGGRHGRDRRGRDKSRKGNSNNNNGNNQSKGNQLGGFFGLGVSVAFSNPTSATYTVRVVGENGDLNYTCPPGFNATLSTDDTAVIFVIHFDGWADNLFLQAINPLVGEPYVISGTEYACTHSGEVSPPIFCGPSMVETSLDVAESTTIPWLNGKSFKAERQSDSSDFKMFLFTALA